MNKIFDKDTYEVFKTKTQEVNLPVITLENLYITQHSNVRTKIDIPENTFIRSNVILQKEKNGTNIEVKRAVIRYKKNYNLVLNIYVSKSDNKYYGKVLTALSDSQLHQSRNMNKGKIESAFNIIVNCTKNEDIFFSTKDYKDLLNH